MSEPHALGDTVHARYRIEGILGRGGAGITYEATDLQANRRVALKQLVLRGVDDWKLVELFEREARVLAHLTHPSIPRYVEHFTVDDARGASFYVAQEIAEGRSLAAWTASGWRPFETDLRIIAEQVLEILNYLHGLHPPVVHRDIKPQNLVRSDDGKISLVDFGGVRDVVRTESGGSTVVGTFGYMAPEQFRGVALPASDLYGLATTILFLVTGRSPADLPQRKLKIDFRAQAKVSPFLSEWLDRMLEPAPEDRFATAADALRALRSARSPSAGRARKRVFALLGVLGVLCATAGVFVVRDVVQERRASKLSLAPPAIGGPAARNLITPLPTRPRHRSHDLELLRKFPAHSIVVYAVTPSPDGKQFATASRDATVKLWDLASGTAVRPFAGHTGEAGWVTFSPDGKQLLTAGDHTARVWDVATGSQVRSLDMPDQATHVEMTPDGATIVASSFDGNARAWDATTGELRRTFPHSPGAGKLYTAVIGTGGRLFTGGDLPVVRIWDLANGALIRSLEGHTKCVNAIALASDGQTLVTASDDRTVKVWHAGTGRLLRTIEGFESDALSVAVSPDAQLVAIAVRTGLITVHDLMTGARREQEYPRADEGSATAVTFTRDGTTLLSSYASGAVIVWKLGAHGRGTKVPKPRDDAPGAPAPHKPSSPEEALVEKARAKLDNWWGASLEETKADLAKAVALNASYGPAYVELARLEMKLGYISYLDYDPKALARAHATLDRAATVMPGSAAIPITRARLFQAEKKADDAKRAAAEAAKLDPKSVQVELLLAELASHALEFDEAERRVVPIITGTRDPSVLLSAYSTLRYVYTVRRDYDAASELYQRENEIAPAAWNKGNYAAFLIDAGDFDGAIAWAEKAIAQMDYGMAHDTLASALTEKGSEALWDRGEPEQAKELFDRALRESPRTVNALYGRGAYYRSLAFRTKKVDWLTSSLEALTKAQQLEPKNALVQRAVDEHPRVVEAVKGMK